MSTELDLLNLTQEESEIPVWDQLLNNESLDPNSVEIRDASTVITDALNNLSLDDFSDEENELQDYEEDNTPTLRLREYQRELAETALTGRNCIVCAPTGSGKTRIAVKAIIEHLQRVPNAKVVFFAKTVPLVMQQYETIRKYIPSNHKVHYITRKSKDSLSLHMLLPLYSVIVLTPTILVNHLSGRNPLLAKGIAAFTLFVFDECHHAHKDDSYNDVMRYYLKEKRNRHLGRNLPQILGLTASIGIEKATDPQKAENNIMKVCCNLDVETLKIVKRNIAELRTVVPKPLEFQEELIEIEHHELKSKILDLMEQMEQTAKDYARDLNDCDVSKVMRCVPTRKQDPEYCHWVWRLRKSVREVKIEDGTEETLAFRYIDIITDYLQAYHFSLESIELAQTEDVLNYLDQRFVDFHNNPERTPQEEDFYQNFLNLKEVASRHRVNVNPNLEKLAAKLREHVVQKGPESRALVFVRTRVLAEAVVSWLDRCGEDDLMGLNARKFTGSNKSGDEGGMTEAEQKHVIEEFRSGTVRVLIATSVAEEGLDIPQCNMVIRYNYSRNEVSKVQTRGRTRAQGGISILLAMPKIVHRDRINGERVNLMEEALVKISEKTSAQFSHEVHSLQDQLFKEWDLKEMEERNRRGMRDVNFRLLCCRCKKVSIHSTDIRIILGAHHVSINRNVLNQIRIETMKEKVMDEFSFVGLVYCQGETEPGKLCGYRIGKIMKYKRCPLLVLGCDKVIFLQVKKRHPDPPYRKWRDTPYCFSELTHDDLMVYANSLTSEIVG